MNVITVVKDIGVGCLVKVSFSTWKYFKNLFFSSFDNYGLSKHFFAEVIYKHFPSVIKYFFSLFWQSLKENIFSKILNYLKQRIAYI